MRIKRPDGRIHERIPCRSGLEFKLGEDVAWDGRCAQKATPGNGKVRGTYSMRDSTYADYIWIFVGVEVD